MFSMLLVICLSASPSEQYATDTVDYLGNYRRYMQSYTLKYEAVDLERLMDRRESREYGRFREREYDFTQGIFPQYNQYYRQYYERPRWYWHYRVVR